MYQARNTMQLRLLALTSLLSGLCDGQYEPPPATVLPLHPRGLRVSIPDEPGITLVAFHGQIDKEFDALEAGSMARDIIRAKGGRWTFEDRSIKLKAGNTIYYWIHVVYEKLGYNLLDQKHLVTDFYHYNGTKVTQTGQSCPPSVTMINGKNPCAGALVFEDNFDRLDTNRWRRVEQFPGSPDSEFVVYRANDKNVKVQNGRLKLTPTLLEKEHDSEFVYRGSLVLDKCTGQGAGQCSKEGKSHQILPPVISGRVDTNGSFSFVYGRVVIRAKVPRGDWIYPLISLDPLVNACGCYESGQLRIARVAGNEALTSATGMDLSGRWLWAGAVTSMEDSVRHDGMSMKLSADGHRWSHDYHDYELEWTPDRYVAKVDGTVYGEKALPNTGYDTQGRLFDKPFFLSLGVAVGGVAEFPDNCTSGNYAKPWRNTEAKAQLKFYQTTTVWSNTWKDDATALEVDYVKVWAL